MTTTQDELAIDVADLRSDAKLWNQAADKAERALGAARGENLPNEYFMMGGILVAEAYRELAGLLLQRLGDGCAQLYGLAGALEAIATEYESYEGEVVNIVNTTAGEIEVHDV